MFQRWTIEGVRCPTCKGCFTWQDGKKQGHAYSLKAKVQCTHCDAWLQYPPHLQHWLPYATLTIAALVVIALLLLLFLNSAWLGIAVGLPLVGLCLEGAFRYLKIEQNHLALVPSASNGKPQ